MPVNVLVGCGGSGIRTLTRLNELLAEDPYWRHRVAQDIYYIVLDTNASDIQSFEEAIGRQMGTAERPVVRSIRLAQNRSYLQPIVNRRFVEPFLEGGDKSAQARLYEHWWVSSEGVPFAAPKVRPLHVGAGQCPPVSYFLTWHDLTKVEEVFDELMNHVIPRRRAGKGLNPLADMNFLIVSGLAGGTGRGSWELIAFKMREMLLEQHGIAPRPIAYLFDSSVYYRIAKMFPKQELSMQVNSLTGVSQLSCWMKNARTIGKPEFTYVLPNMRSPADHATDVLDVDLFADPLAVSPVDNAYMIFGTNGYAVLDDHKDYQHMVATAIYAALTRSAITSAMINDDPAYKSLSAATFEISGVTLRSYFEGMYRLKAMQMLSDVHQPTIDKAADGFKKRVNLDVGLTERDRRGFRADATGTFLQRVCDGILRRTETDRSGLSGALERDDPEEVKLTLQALLSPRPSLVERVMTEEVGELKTGPEDAALEEIREILKTTRSVADVQRFVAAVRDHLEHEIDSMPSPERMRMGSEDDPLALVDEYQGREYIAFGRRFNEQESREIEDKARDAILIVNYKHIRDGLEAQYAEWSQRLRRWEDNADIVLKRALKLHNRFQGELVQELGGVGVGFDDLFDTLFCDPNVPERAIPDRFAADRFYRRIVKPVLRRGQETKILPKVEFSEELVKVINDALLHDRLDRDSSADVQTLSRNLEAAVRNTVHLPLEFVSERFGLSKVVEDLCVVWLRRFKKRAGDPGILNRLIAQFESFFGTRPRLDGDEWVLPGTEEFLTEMGYSLAATCRPFWRLREAKHDQLDIEQHRVSVFFPVTAQKFDSDKARETIEGKLEQAETRIEVYTADQMKDDLGQARSNPFLLLAFSVEGTQDIERIASLDYYKDTPGLYRMLNRCEDAEGQSVFEQTRSHNGLGYTDPLFVRNEVVRNARWRPWMDPLEQKVEAKKTYDALIYALMDPPEDLKAQLEEFGWSMPMVMDQGREVFVFRRRALKLQDGEAVVDRESPWEETRPRIAQSVWQVLDVLMGKGNKVGNLKREGAEWRDRILQESALFWDTIAVKFGVSQGSDGRRKLLQAVEAQLDAMAKGKGKAKSDDKDLKVWKQLISRVIEMQKS